MLTFLTTPLPYTSGMSARRFPFPVWPSNRRQWLAVALIGAVLLAHLMLIERAKDSLALIQMLDEEDDTVIVELQSDKTVAETHSARPLPPPVKRAPPAPLLPPPESKEAPPVAAAPAASAPSATSADNANSASAESAPSVSSPPVASATASKAESDSTSAPPSSSAALFARVSFPPPAELSFDALAVQGNRQLSGSGSIVWQHDGQSYQIKGEASALLLTLLSYQSSGQIGAAGIVPELYHEKRIGKSATSTHFVRERKTISFSASTATYDIQGGEQDRGSVIWQLAGLARGDPDKLEPGLAFEAVVAGSKAADRWRVQVVGKENLTLSGNAGGTVNSWHLALAPTENNFDYQIDLWLSPDRDGYPVKIMYANRSGATLTLTLAKLNRK